MKGRKAEKENKYPFSFSSFFVCVCFASDLIVRFGTKWKQLRKLVNTPSSLCFHLQFFRAHSRSLSPWEKWKLKYWQWGWCLFSFCVYTPYFRAVSSSKYIQTTGTTHTLTFWTNSFHAFWLGGIFQSIQSRLDVMMTMQEFVLIAPIYTFHWSVRERVSQKFPCREFSDFNY